MSTNYNDDDQENFFNDTDDDEFDFPSSSFAADADDSSLNNRNPRLVRLQKLLSNAGLASRRNAEQLLLDGKIEVNGQVVAELGTKVDPMVDAICVNGQPLDCRDQQKVYLVFHKPRGVVTTCYDPEGRPMVMDYVKDIPHKIYPVGRLDYLSEGLLILTNDGDLANNILHPRYKVTKVYEVKVFGHMNPTILLNLKRGIRINGKLVKPLSVRVLEQLPKKTWLEFRLQEGKNREIRKFCEAQGLTVDKLKRVAIEGLTIQDVAPGKYYSISKKVLLQKLGLDRNGEKSSAATVEFQSNKKTAKVANFRGRFQQTPLANDDRFYKFRKQHYQKTMEVRKTWEQESAEEKPEQNGNTLLQKNKKNFTPRESGRMSERGRDRDRDGNREGNRSWDRDRGPLRGQTRRG